MQNKVSAWKKTAMTALAFSMLAGSAAGVASAKSKHGDDDDKRHSNVKVQYNLSFKDLNEQQWKWAYAHIIRLCAEGVFKGYDDGSFKPRNNVSRIETIVATVRLLGLEAEAQKPENMNAKLNFKDFDQLKKKYPQAVGYVAVALKNDLFTENEVSIQAEKPATRLWASVLLVKGMKLEADAKAKMGVELPFKDEDRIPAGSVGYVAVALEKNLVAGYPDNSFQPNKPVTRAELAAILSRLGVQLPDHNPAPGQTDNVTISGTVTASVYGTLSVQKADNTIVNVPLDENVFVFRNGTKVAASAIQVGDVVTLRTSGGKAFFIEVTQTAPVVVPLTDAGKVGTFTYANGKLSTISIVKDVNGVSTTVVYNVDANVTINPANGTLAANSNVVVTGENGVVKVIQIVS